MAMQCSGEFIFLVIVILCNCHIDDWCRYTWHMDEMDIGFDVE